MILLKPCRYAREQNKGWRAKMSNPASKKNGRRCPCSIQRIIRIAAKVEHIAGVIERT